MFVFVLNSFFIFVPKLNNSDLMKKVIQVILVIVILVLGYFIYESVQKPIRFEAEQTKRYNAAIERLKDIRTAQVAYRTVYGKYTGSFDTLIYFLNSGRFKVVNMEGSIPDSLLDAGMTEKEALKKGLIKRDTVEVAVKDSLFKAPDFKVDSIAVVPFTNGKKFEMKAGEVVTGSKVKVNVFEAKVSNDILLEGLDRQLIINFNEYRAKVTGYPGLQVGSLDEANNNAGNWE
jgi:hypothetical protein